MAQRVSVASLTSILSSSLRNCSFCSCSRWLPCGGTPKQLVSCLRKARPGGSPAPHGERLQVPLQVLPSLQCEHYTYMHSSWISELNQAPAGARW
jgi:hypothetical protein